MRFLGPFAVVLMLLLPVSARAQSVKMADLVGNWDEWSLSGPSDTVPRGKYTPTRPADGWVTIKGDSTSTRWADSNFATDTDEKHRVPSIRVGWSVSGDTLDFEGGKYRILQHDGQVFVLSGGGAMADTTARYIFKRAGAPKPTP
jgi:hypothetical protein